MVQFEREFIREEFRTWKQEFVDEFADMLYRRSPGTRHPKFFGKFIPRYVYALGNSNGVILEMLDNKNPVVYTSGGRSYKMFQYLSYVLGLTAFRAHFWKTNGVGSEARTREV